MFIDDITLIGVVLFFLIGMILSLLGAGGSILTVPTLVYVFKVQPHLATSYSLFLVGICNWIAAIHSIKHHLVLIKPALYFAIPGLLTTFIIRRFVLPSLPAYFIHSDALSLTKGNVIMIVFACLMLMAAIKSLRAKKDTGNELPEFYVYKVLVFQGLGVGLVTGFVGAGGGFLIIPALVFTSKVPMKYAVATSLLIISITTTLGFLGDFNPSIHIKWSFLFFYTLVAALGVFLANGIKHLFSNKILRISFGLLILALSFFIYFTEIKSIIEA